MQTHVLTNEDGWVLVSNAAVCRIQVLNSWHPGMLRVHVGPSLPTDTSPFFEVVQGENWIKTTDVDNVYVYAHRGTTEHPLTITVSDKVDGTAGGGSGGSGLTDAELRAAAVEVTSPTTVDKLEEMRLQLVTLLGNTDTLESLNESTNTLVTNLITYVDQLETLSTSLVTNTTDLAALLSQLGLNTDDIETLIATLTAKFPASLGKKTAAQSLSVTLDSDDGLQAAIEELTKPADTQLVNQVSAVYTPTYTRVSGMGTISNATSVTISNVGTVPGTVLGASLLPNETVNFDAPLNGVLGDITYSSTATTFAIVVLTKV